jgi:hypothetical protein
LTLVLLCLAGCASYVKSWEETFEPFTVKGKIKECEEKGDYQGLCEVLQEAEEWPVLCQAAAALGRTASRVELKRLYETEGEALAGWAALALAEEKERARWAIPILVKRDPIIELPLHLVAVLPEDLNTPQQYMKDVRTERLRKRLLLRYELTAMFGRYYDLETLGEREGRQSSETLRALRDAAFSEYGEVKRTVLEASGAYDFPDTYVAEYDLLLKIHARDYALAEIAGGGKDEKRNWDKWWAERKDKWRGVDFSAELATAESKYDEVLNLLITGDGNRKIVVGRRDTKTLLSVDGTEYECDGYVKNSLRLSPDGRRLAYILKRRKSSFLLVDGEEHGPHKGISRVNTVFSRDGKHLAYVAEGSRYTVPVKFVVLDDYEGKRYIDIGERKNMVFSEDGSRFAYFAKASTPTGLKWIAVVDGKEGHHFSALASGSLMFSADGKNVGYVGEKGGSWHIVLNEKVINKYTGDRTEAGFRSAVATLLDDSR